MQTKRIFVSGNFEVYAALFTEKDGIRDPELYEEIEDPDALRKMDEYQKAMERWHHPEYLHHLFRKYQKDLATHTPGMAVSKAVLKTIDEATRLSQVFLDMCDGKGKTTMDTLFRPLNDNESDTPPYSGQAMKIRGLDRSSWLRLYSLKYDNAYLLTGGAIKLTRTMNNRPHLQAELYKLNYAASAVNAGTGIQGFIDIYGTE